MTYPASFLSHAAARPPVRGDRRWPERGDTAARAHHRGLAPTRSRRWCPELLAEARLPDRRPWRRSTRLAQRIATQLRQRRSATGRAGLVQGLLQEYALSSQEGVALMCLAEALLRIPDAPTRDALIRDKIAHGQWQTHAGRSPSVFVNGRDLGPAADRQAGRDPQRDRPLGPVDPADRQGRRAADPQGRRHGDAHDGRAVRHRRDHRRGLAACARPGGRGFPVFVRHARRSRADRSRCGALPARLRSGDRRDRPGLRGPRCDRRPGHLDQALGTPPALCTRAAGPRHDRALPGAARPRAAGAPARHRPQHRCGRVGPPRAVAGPAGTALRRTRPGGLERHRLRDPGLPEALPAGDRFRDRPGAAQRASPDGAAGQGRLLGQRDQARPARRPGGLPGLHAQGLHRPRLPRLRAPAAGCARRGLSAVRDPQRAHHVGDPRAGGSCHLHARPVRVPMPARHGRAALRTGGGPDRTRQARSPVPHLRPGGHARDPARLPGAPPAGERRQHLVREPHRRSDDRDRDPGRGPGRDRGAAGS